MVIKVNDGLAAYVRAYDSGGTQLSCLVELYTEALAAICHDGTRISVARVDFDLVPDLYKHLIV